MKVIVYFVLAILFSLSTFATASNLGDLIWEGKNSEAIQMMNKSPELVNTQNSIGYTPLHLASMVGNKEIVLFLVDKGVNFNATDGEGYSPLVRAKVNRHQEIVDILVKHVAKAVKP